MHEIKGFLQLLRPYRKQVFCAFLAILIADLLGLAFPWAIKIVIDRVLPARDVWLLNALVLGLLLIFCLKFCFGFLREYLAVFVGERLVADLRNRLYWHTQRLSVGYVENTATGSIVSGIIGDVEGVKRLLFGGAIDFLHSFFDVFFVTTLLFILDVRLALISLAYLPVFGLTFLKFTPRLKERHEFVRAKYAELTARLSEVLNAMRIVSGFAREEHETGQFRSKQQEIVQASMASHRLGIALWMSSEFLSSLGLALLIWLGAQAVFSGRITAGTLMAFYTYLGMLFFPVIRMAGISDYYQEAVVALARINKVLAREPAVREARQPLKVGRLKGDIEFRDVWFGYDAKRQVLSGIDLEVKGSQVVALVGASGAGKTTLINLLLRFYDPSRGTVFVDGHNLKDLDLRSYRSNIAMVLQDDYLFCGTIGENILYGKPEATESQMYAAAALANAHEFIAGLADGYDTLIGERGVKLSYGQRQRISIARALLRDPAILILDEATSCVDSESERLIIEQAFRKLMKGRTTIMIAHRFSAIAHADRIIVLEAGRIVETGSHAELLARRGRYWSAWARQHPDTVFSSAPR